MILSEKEIRTLEEWNERLTRSVSIILQCTEDARSERFKASGDTLMQAASNLKIITEEIGGFGAPAFVSGPWHYHGIPAENELEPFIEVISPTDVHMPQLMKDRLESVPFAPDIKIFVTPQCHFCPGAIRQMIPFALAVPQCRAMIVDSLLFPEMAEAYRVKAVPTMILNDVYRLTGEIRLSGVVEVLEKSDVTQLHEDSLKRMLKEGQAKLLAEMMLAKQQLFPGFLPLLTHPEWSVRLGAMVVLEEVAESDKELARTALASAWSTYSHREASVRGDIVHLIAELGEKGWIPALESLIDREGHGEVRNVIAEALSKMKAE